VIGPKQRPLHAGVETVLVNRGYKVLEPNELAELRKLLQGLASATPRGKSTAAVKFFKRVYGGVSPDDREFTAKLLKCESQRPRRADRKALVQAHSEGTTPELLLALLEYTEGLKGISCKLTESISALKCILEKHIESGTDLRSLYADEIAKRKFQSRSNVYRCTGSTLLVKGLEFDHAVILRSPNWQENWGNYRDLYVALTRGSKTTTLIDLTG
jgi:DNA helicase-2/ATP-dependent DNA helicase PcrA